MYRIIACDDNENFLNALTMILNKYASIYKYSVFSFKNGDDLFEYCKENDFDIIFMDIEIGKYNGMDLAKQLKLINVNALIIYMSGYDTYYTDMVQAEPFRFISKSETFLRIDEVIVECLDSAISRLEHRDVWSFTFKRVQYYVELSKIVYFYSIARIIYFNGNTKNRQNYFYGKIDELQEEIGKINQNFARISKSHLVNMKYILPIYGKSKIRIGNETFSVTRKYRDSFWDRYRKYYWKKRDTFLW